MGKDTLRIISPNGHLGFAPTKEGSFYIGAETKPDYYCCDSGSDDIGPVPLGMDKCASHPDWQYHDLELMLLASREQGVPCLLYTSRGRYHGHWSPESLKECRIKGTGRFFSGRI